MNDSIVSADDGDAAECDECTDKSIKLSELLSIHSLKWFTLM